jgi:CheY-like chemotaxis protein
VRGAARRGADLTRRLLAFSRRQTLQPKETDLNKLVQGMEGLLRRTFREDIEIHCKLAPDLWPAMIDGPQVENALLNLAVNARDAMPHGGRLVIETANFRLDDETARTFRFAATTGDYVMLSVNDSGTGIAPELQKRVFEPFFTTKEAGKGTGLGLSMVYGFVKQSGGFVNIYSELGHGTVVKLYLPRGAATGVLAEDAPVAGGRAAGGHERILVVEDDELVRQFVVLRLKEFGYTVLDAPDGVSALAMLRSEGPVDLLFTDVVLPKGMNGRAVAEEARRLYPRLKVLFTSGYTQDAFVDRGTLDPGTVLLSKPYEKDELARKVRAVLDALV